MSHTPSNPTDGWIGSSPPRADGPSKVMGTAKYIADMHFDQAIDAAVIRSPHARARIMGIDLDPAFDWTDVVVVTAEDIDHNEMAVIQLDQPVLAATEVRHAYEPVALLACADRAKLERAAQHVLVRYEPLDPVLTIDDAIARKQVIFGDDNVMVRYRVAHGDAKAAIDNGEVVVRGVYAVGHQEHMYIEPNGCVAWWDDAGLHVTGSFQCPYYVEKALKHALDLSHDRIDVVQSVTGGAFGGKEEYPSVLAVHAALLSRKARRPVRLIYDRKQDIESTTKRHPALMHVATACDRDGTLRALMVDVVMDAGAYVTLTPVVLSRGVLHAFGPYKWEHALIEGRAVATNTPPNGAFRGFGAPQTVFALERHLDRVAAELGMDPLALRKKNLLVPGAPMPTGQVVKSIAVDECVRLAEAESRYEVKRRSLGRAAAGPGQRKVRGIGASVFMHGAGFTGSGEERLKGRVAVDLLRDGKVRVRSSSTDMGQGTETVFRQIAAEACGIPFASTQFAVPSTAHVPDSGPTVASRTVMIVGSVVEQAARAIGARVRAEMDAHGGSFEEAANRLIEREGAVVEERQYKSPPGIHFDDKTYTGTAYPAYAWACDIAEVEVDLDTFEVAVVGFWSAVDVGRAIHPVMCAGQLEGGALQAIGWALCEEVLWKDGKILNPRMTSYIVPTARDAPAFFTSLVEDPYEYGPGGAKGIGELPMDGGAPAIAAAIEHATGLRFDQIPITPERMLDAWLADRAKEAR
jgi:CO/xanthine dehydrogenase Mo-binding subunit